MVSREECENIFTLSRKAPLMEYGLKSLGNIGMIDTSLAIATVRGEASVPEDMNKVTIMVIEGSIEMAKGHNKEFGDKPMVSAGRFMSFWSKVSDRTQSSISALYYGHARRQPIIH